MGRVDLLLTKEEINDDLLQNKVAVVLDILLATSTITSLFHQGAKEIIPVSDGAEALKEKQQQVDDNFILTGEYLGSKLDGFLRPSPIHLNNEVNGKRVVFSSTNGTVALKKSKAALASYAASMLNEKVVAKHLVTTYKRKPIVLVCSGSSGEFSLEDFFGAGSFIKALLDESANGNLDWEMSDSAMTAFHFYEGNKGKGEQLLKASRIGTNLINNGFEEEISYIMQKNKCPVIPRLEGRVLKLIEPGQ